ncbi:MAG: L-histidine N(alpha)-methyltransferase [Planctomycetota bacterium]
MSISIHDAQAHLEQFRRDVILGLDSPRKSLPCKHFYDARGSALFDRICELDEYYLTRAETQIMQNDGSEMGEAIGNRAMLIEYGSGSSTKTRVLMNNLHEPSAYVPVDISRDHLLETSARLRVEFPDIEILPVVADFSTRFRLPVPTREKSHNAVYFPGSTIGNLEQCEAERLLQQIADQCGTGGGLLIGIDLDKDSETLERAYNDEQGVTADFNLNMLHRIRNELGGVLDLEGFEHEAKYNGEQSRIEIFIRSTRAQQIVIGENSFSIAEGERIHTEYSHKYSIAGFAKMAARAGLTLRRSWTDDRDHFAVLHFVRLDTQDT